ncbi:outer membrane protein [Bradyrhizobium iriomotense]|uniref:outer membrane protein n=1 Tax=Bradyrhizobium iriomotense TaxID=441950 RepID=UPI0024E19366|nr:outer membrane beta-barrel protein [Bradyrhizobium iriomotense]
MKKVLLASASLFALSAFAPAMAADLAARPYTKAPVAAVAVYDWTGFYLGLNAGGGSSHNCWDLINVGGVPGGPVAEGCHNATGGMVGGQVGYRWQATNWVFGLEAQGDWADLKGSNTSLALGGIGANNTKIDAIGLFTGQVGYAWSSVLWYVKGGAAVTHNKYRGTFVGTDTEFDSASETRWGAAVGTGIEFGFAPNWSVAIEYDHLFMDKRDVTFPATAFAASRIDTIKQDVDMATVRVNYRFGGPVIAKY